jgi:hypothetical protein
MTVEIQLKEQAQAIRIEGAINAYTKGRLYCVMVLLDGDNRRVDKFPLESIFRIREFDTAPLKATTGFIGPQPGSAVFNSLYAPTTTSKM